jgi:pimeloyl-ACP methyl ester carboxylesterase
MRARPACWRLPARLAGLAAGLATVAGLGACASSPAGQFTPPGLRHLRGCAEAPGFTCGDLTVPVSPSGPAAGHLSLQVGMSRAAAPRGVLLFLTGGPGQPGVPFLPRVTRRLGPALAGYRLVMFDQRGTGAGALNCPALQERMGGSDLTVPAAAAVRACAAAIGDRRRYFATADTVADIEALRRALGVRTLTLDGVSYGTYVAEQFALAHPREVARLVLDSVVPDANVDPLQLANMRDSARVLRAVCAAQHCGFDPAEDVATVVRRYHDGPALLDMLVALSVGDPTFGGVLGALHSAAAGQPAALLRLMRRVRAADAATASELSQGLHASTLCADLTMPWGGPDTPTARRAAALARAVGRLTPQQTWPFDRATAAGNGFIQTCLYWPPEPVAAPQVPPGTRLPDVPVLIMAGGRDLSTPIEEDRAELAVASGGRLFYVPAAGHSVQGRAAGDPAVPALTRFLQAG